MNNPLYPFLITTLAGLSTVIGFLIIFVKKDKDKILISSLSFASGVMICVSLTDLIPTSFTYLTTKYFSIFAFLILITMVTLGIFISSLIDKCLPSGNGSNIYRIGILSMLIIMLHNIPEGIATFISSTSNIELGITLSIAIALHNIPEGISIAYPIFYSTASKKKSFFYTLIAGISEPFGALLAYMFLSRFINDTFMGLLLGIIAGIMLQISLYELLPEALSYKDKKCFYKYLFLGILVMLISHFI